MDTRHKLHRQEGRKMKVDQLVQLYLRTGKLEGKTESTSTRSRISRSCSTGIGAGPAVIFCWHSDMYGVYENWMR